MGYLQDSSSLFSSPQAPLVYTHLAGSTTTMVRLKNRYLLVNILYPELDNQPKNPKIPDVVVFHQPTTNALTASALLKGLKAEVDDLFGDYGSGAIADRLVGKEPLLSMLGVGMLSWVQSDTYRPRLQHLFLESRATIIELRGLHSL